MKNDDPEYVVDMTHEMKNAIESGSLKLDVAKDGQQIFAQLRDNGKYGKKLPIKKIVKEKGIDPMQLSTALQTKAIENQLTGVITTLDSIEAEVGDVKSGQQNDRIALFYSGMNLYSEARTLNDPEMKKQLIAQSLKSISDSNSQVIQQLQNDIQYLIDKQYAKKKGSSYEDMQEHMMSVNKSFDLIRESCMMKAAIYYDQGELSAMMTALEEYSHFIEKVIIPTVPKLTELDSNITTLQNGIWEQRAKSISMVDEIKRELECKNTYTLEFALDGGNEMNDVSFSDDILEIKGVAYA